MRTALCDLLGIDVPVVQASLGPWSHPELPAAVSNAGGLGTLGTALVEPDALRRSIARVRELTDRPFAINVTRRPFDPVAVALALEARPRVISIAIGEPGGLVTRAHDAGALLMAQVHSPEQATTAIEQGADILIAQGGEAGGFGAEVSTMTLVPQVVDVAGPVPVLAAGGIADGRGLAAALALGAQGVNLGTRFVAATEAGVPEAYQQAIVGARSEDAVKVRFAPQVFPPAGTGGYLTLPRALRTPFITEFDPAAREAAAARLRESVAEGRAHELVPFAGQTVGLIREVEPAAAILERLVREADAALAAAGAAAGSGRA
jgi:nitronate monooxygenase/enoyl-[acyl-carrier protein] reductase II